ncbi:hydroxyacid dehydrogenase [Aerococcus urinaehominis]|uniref:Hydroxyacid dehydrogenase n=1 Tax=Aerococcus urinaehominis TaxID=128944 RepID=A0A0X8FKL2_9LACT|nr:NAD(P)-dependent oxidoreductase [Aerococcus urinaehominis]AMB99032.1 hydroxyacid dehydrogenase [Aerococcus urinaehominis]SDM51060.1 D-3-phosphoglycerate dehydrogenase [Aerococcus urinaehominis]
MKIKLLEPLNVPAETIDALAQPLREAGHDFVYYDERTTDPQELAKRSQDADIVIIANTPYPKEAFAGADNLKLIDVAFTGIDHVDTEAAEAAGIRVANAAGYAATAVPELVLGLTLGLYRHLLAGDQDTRQVEDFTGQSQGREIKGKTVGIVGTGNLGIETARLFKAFGVKLLGYNRSEKAEAKDLGLEYVDLDELLSQSDIVTIHLPATKETEKLIDKTALAKMKKDAILINVARGPIVDNDALAQALNKGEIAGAGIDVYDMEPPIPSDYPLLSAKNTLLTPHVGFLTDEAMLDRAQIAFKNAEKFIAGDPQNILV